MSTYSLSPRVLAAAVALLLGVAFCGTSAVAHEPDNAGSPPMEKMAHEGMPHTPGMSMTGDADYDFAVNMRQHHAMAVTMSQEELKRGTDATLRNSAEKVIVDPTREIADLERWIALHKKAGAH